MLTKIVPILLLSVFCAVICNGQVFWGKIFIEPRGNVSYARLINSKSPFGYGNYDQKALNTYSKSILIGYRLSERFSLHTGYSYENKGTVGTYKFFKVYGYEYGMFTEDKVKRVTVENNYHTFPIFLRVYTKENNISFFGDLGLYVSSLTKSSIRFYRHETTTEADGVISSEWYENSHVTNKKFTNSFDYGLIVGGGLAYKIHSRIAIQFNPQVSIGFKKLDHYNSNDRILLPVTSGVFIMEKDYFGLSSKSKNLHISFNLGLRYKVRE